ncbi:BatA domain-containing protein [Kiritimatiellaeota bacterium B1221]|nr:BatA domain-containing protein [Kiritimatiellaeota bacterium B1221]
MGISFAHPAALWGLLGLPVILAIHFLQSRNRREEVSSLFLLELLPEETRSGAIFSYVRNGLQLWMQLLAVVLITVLMARPMRLREESVQTIMVVVDSSVSMRAFGEELKNEMDRMSTALEKTAGRSEWWLLYSDSGRPGLAKAVSPEQFSQSLEIFDPLSGPHSPRAALMRARQLAGPEGLVIYVSDHILDRPPAGAVAVSLGHPISNMAFTGMTIEGNRWTASVLLFGGKSEGGGHSSEETSHEVQVYINGELSDTVPVQLSPGRLGQISGELPADFERGRLVLAEDGYDFDNGLPFVKPKVKPLNFSVAFKRADQIAWAEKLMGTLPGSRKNDPAVLAWREGWPLKPDPEVPAEIWWLNGEVTAAFAPAVPGGDSLAEGLRWEGFLALPYTGFQVLPSDQVQLWMGEHPLVIRRESPAGTRLMMNFDLAGSNAMRFPSMLLLLHRFMKEQQDLQPLPFSTQLETRQLLPVQPGVNEVYQTRFEDLAGNILEGEIRFGQRATAPEKPGYFTVKNGEELLMRAGVFAGDVAEGNFAKARPQPLPQEVVTTRRERNSQTDFLMPLWFILLAGVLTLAWWSEKAGERA